MGAEGGVDRAAFDLAVALILVVCAAGIGWVVLSWWDRLGDRLFGWRRDLSGVAGHDRARAALARRPTSEERYAAAPLITWTYDPQPMPDLPVEVEGGGPLADGVAYVIRVDAEAIRRGTVIARPDVLGGRLDDWPRPPSPLDPEPGSPR